MLLITALQGCYQAQLNGGIAGAEVRLAPLRAPGDAVLETRTRDEASMIDWRGEAEWRRYDAAQKAPWMGVFYLPAAVIDPNEVYLVTASGGRETDYDHDLRYESEQLGVRGSWHAILPGGHARGLRNKVSLLTEACYQWLSLETAGNFGSLERAELLARLDRAANRLVEDINGDGRVDYTDVLHWNSGANRDGFKGNPTLLDSMNTAVLLGLPDNLRQQIAAEMMGEKVWSGSRLGNYLKSRLAGDPG
jgi:hypothetical protein